MNICPKYHTCLIAKGIKHVCPACQLYTDIANFCGVDISQSRYRNVCEVINAPEQLAHVENERYSYTTVHKWSDLKTPYTLYTTSPLRTVWNRWLDEKPLRRRTRRCSRKNSMKTHSCLPSSNDTARSSGKCLRVLCSGRPDTLDVCIFLNNRLATSTKR